jgi:hypothetical protein
LTTSRFGDILYCADWFVLNYCRKSEVTNMDIKELELITPQQFQKEFAPSVGINSIRELFRREEFPGIKLGTRFFTTREAAMKWLSTMGKPA